MLTSLNKIYYSPFIKPIDINNKNHSKNRQFSTQTQICKTINPQSNLIYFTGRKPQLPFLERLPGEIQKVRDDMIDDAIKFIRSPEFYNEKIAGKNWRNPYIVNEMTVLINNPEILRRRADMLTLKSCFALQSNYANKETIIIPWSGGRDSSSILANSFAFFNDKKFKLLTVINGMSENILNPIIQYKRLLSKFEHPSNPINVEHYYLDCVDDMRDFVIKTARQDRKRLSCPALCSSCKMVMEKALGNVTKKFNSHDIVLGYSMYQGMQDWIEQTPEQISYVSEELWKHGIRTSSPLYNVLKFPFDPILSLSSIGVPINEQKIEMKCKAGGLNPKNLDKMKLFDFLIHKNEQTNNIFDKDIKIVTKDEIANPKYISLLDEIQKLRQDKEYRLGVFEEKKYNGQ
ncbi:MAG: hypothetical protein MJ230_00200 [bacterium]|nr:hypothetical protein [bacterium]